MLLLANLRSFYEQVKYHKENAEEIREYLVDPPLWMLICRTVAASKAELLDVLRFFHRFVINRADWSIKSIDAILKSESGIHLEDGQDLFKDRLTYLRAGRKPTAKSVFAEILKLALRADAPGELEIHTFKKAGDEVGLRVGGSETYFGLLNIGDVSAFKKLAEKEAPELVIAEDAIKDPLFPEVKHATSEVNLLIGAKKFMEGWSSWRVSNIGLLNVGVSEGSEIIQLFGRGVRLKGRGFNLQRSAALPGIDHPQHLKILETLNIFAVRANYMTKFREYLEREGVETGGFIEMELPLWKNTDFLKKDLRRPVIKDSTRFLEEMIFCLEVDSKLKVKLDVTTRVRSIQSVANGNIHEFTANDGWNRKLESPQIGLLDWRQIHLDLVHYKQSRGYSNMTIPAAAPKAIIEQQDPACYALAAPEEWMNPRSLDQFQHLQETVTSILRKYTDRFYNNRRQKWESDHMEYETLKVSDDNFQNYRVSVPRADVALAAAIRDIVEEAKLLSAKPKAQKIFAGEQGELPNCHFDRHLYQPLLVSQKKAEVKLSPKGLNEGETRFVNDLAAYSKREATGALKGKELFLLRNHGRGKGIGFFDARGFYPDFILWIKEGKKQRILFVEPHGLMLEAGGINSEKVDLHRKLREYSKKSLTGKKLAHIEVDACVISVTPYDDLYKRDADKRSREDFTKARVLFQETKEGYDYIELLLA